MRKYIVTEEVLRALGLLSFDEGQPVIGKGYDYYPIQEFAEPQKSEFSK